MQDDWLMKQLRFLPKKLPVIRQTNNDPLIDVEDSITGEKRSVPLTQYLLEQIMFLNLNYAENILFENIEKMSSEQADSIVFWFYNKISSLSDNDLEKASLLREEIHQGLNDAKVLIEELKTKI